MTNNVFVCEKYQKSRISSIISKTNDIENVIIIESITFLFIYENSQIQRQFTNSLKI